MAVSILTVFLAWVAATLLVSWLAWPTPQGRPEPRSEALVHHSCPRGHEYRATVRDTMQHGCPDCAVIDVFERARTACSREVKP